jgi:hypothetical protein
MSLLLSDIPQIAPASAVYKLVLTCRGLTTMVHFDPNRPGATLRYLAGCDPGGVSAGPNPAKALDPADCNTKQADASNGTSPDKRAHSTHTPPDESQLNGHNIYTETGDSTNRGTTGDGNRNTSMKYMLDRIKDEALNCIANHELDQLMNAYQVSPPAGDDGFGQSDPNNQLIFEVDHNPEILLAIDNATMQPSEQVWDGQRQVHDSGERPAARRPDD